MTTADAKPFWALMRVRELPRRPGPQFWTGEDYTPDISRAMTFRSEDDARRDF